MTQQEVGDLFGVSLQAIQQVEYRAIRKLRCALLNDPDIQELIPREPAFTPRPARRRGSEQGGGR